MRGVFAGNIFDLGCKATTDAYHEVVLFLMNKVLLSV